MILMEKYQLAHLKMIHAHPKLPSPMHAVNVQVDSPKSVVQKIMQKMKKCSK